MCYTGVVFGWVVSVARPALFFGFPLSPVGFSLAFVRVSRFGGVLWLLLLALLFLLLRPCRCCSRLFGPVPSALSLFAPPPALFPGGWFVSLFSPPLVAAVSLVAGLLASAVPCPFGGRLAPVWWPSRFLALRPRPLLPPPLASAFGSLAGFAASSPCCALVASGLLLAPPLAPLRPCGRWCWRWRWLRCCCGGGWPWPCWWPRWVGGSVAWLGVVGWLPLLPRPRPRPGARCAASPALVAFAPAVVRRFRPLARPAVRFLANGFVFGGGWACCPAPPGWCLVLSFSALSASLGFSPSAVGFAGSRRASAASRASAARLAGLASAAGLPVFSSCAPGLCAAAVAAAPRARVFRAASGPWAALPPGPRLAARASAFVRALAASGPSPVLLCWPGRACPVPAPAARRSWSSCGSGSWSELALAVGLGCSAVCFSPPGPAVAGWGGWVALSGPLAGGWLLPAPARLL